MSPRHVSVGDASTSIPACPQGPTWANSNSSLYMPNLTDTLCTHHMPPCFVGAMLLCCASLCCMSLLSDTSNMCGPVQFSSCVPCLATQAAALGWHGPYHVHTPVHSSSALPMVEASLILDCLLIAYGSPGFATLRYRCTTSCVRMSTCQGLCHC